jgi:hypothetical protein
MGGICVLMKNKKQNQFFRVIKKAVVILARSQRAVGDLVPDGHRRQSEADSPSRFGRDGE